MLAQEPRVPHGVQARRHQKLAQFYPEADLPSAVIRADTENTTYRPTQHLEDDPEAELASAVVQVDVANTSI